MSLASYNNTLTVKNLQAQINQLQNSLLQATTTSGVSGMPFPKYQGIYGATLVGMSSYGITPSSANVEMPDWEKPLRLAKGELLKRYMKNSPIWQT